MAKISSLAEFQKIQQAFSAHIRDPENRAYDAGEIPAALPIEERRLTLYENLFFNNIHDTFSNQFPVLYSLLSEERWAELLREYMVKHQAKTPLFHELGQEFLLFLQQEYQPLESDPPFMFELAHYEWIEVALAIAPEEGFENSGSCCALDRRYELSPVAWYLSYAWPVNQISSDYIPEEPDDPTTLLAYRDSEDRVQFMELSPVLYHLIAELDANEHLNFREVVSKLAKNYNQPLDGLLPFAKDVLETLYQKNIVRPV